MTCVGKNTMKKEKGGHLRDSLCKDVLCVARRSLRCQARMAPLHESRPSSAPSEKKVSPIVFMKRRIRGELPATSRGARRVAGDLPPTLQRSPSRCELDKLEAVLRDTTEHIMRDEGQRAPCVTF